MVTVLWDYFTQLITRILMQFIIALNRPHALVVGHILHRTCPWVASRFLVVHGSCIYFLNYIWILVIAYTNKPSKAITHCFLILCVRKGVVLCTQTSDFLRTVPKAQICRQPLHPNYSAGLSAVQHGVNSKLRPTQRLKWNVTIHFRAGCLHLCTYVHLEHHLFRNYRKLDLDCI